MKYILLLTILLIAFINPIKQSVTNLFYYFANIGTVQGSGKIISESRMVGDFNKISLNGSGEMIITQADQESLDIKTDDNIMPLLRSTVKNGKLIIDVKDYLHKIRPSQSIKFYVSLKDLSDLEVNGTATINIDSIKTDSLTITLNGASYSSLEGLTTQNVKSTINGTGTIRVAGKTKNQSITLNGAGNYNAPELTSKNTKVEINGIGHAIVHTDENLDIQISGVGSVEYYGDPEIKKSVGTFGSITQLKK